MRQTTSYQNRLRRWELALLLGVAAACLLGGRLDAQQRALADKVVRLHVIAHSDGAEDQALKLRVRDALLIAAAALPPAESAAEALEILTGALPTLQTAAEEAVAAANGNYPAVVSVTRSWFPTKRYADFALPAGQYAALRVELGGAAGENWWCVVFPPLCLGAVTEETADTAAAAGMTQREVALITGESGGYVVKFKALEWWDALKTALADEDGQPVPANRTGET